MSDQQNEWWNDAASTPPAPPAPVNPGPAPREQSPPDATIARGPAPAQHADPDATVVIPARHPGAAPGDPGQGGAPAQYAPPGPPPGSPPPQYGGQPPQYANPPAHHGGPQFVQPAGPTSRYRAPGGSITMLVGAFLAILGTFLPWITFGDDSVNGYETYFIGDSLDGFEWTNPGAFVAAAMVIVIVSAVIVLAAGRRIATWIIALLAVVLGGAMVLAAFAAVGSVLNDAFDRDAFGIGLGIVLCLVGAIISGLGAIVIAAKKS